MEEAAIFVENESEETIEWMASKMALRTEEPLSQDGIPPQWNVIEIWRSMGRVAVSDSSTTRIGLSLTAAKSTSRKCYSMMKAPGGHFCVACMNDKTAVMMRHAVEATFTPGIALVGRCWLRGRSEIVDIATAELSTYARAVMAADAGLSTAIAVPVICQQSVTAVVVVYFKNRLETLAAMTTLEAMTDVDGTLPYFTPSSRISAPMAQFEEYGGDGSEDRFSMTSSSATGSVVRVSRSIDIPSTVNVVSLSPQQRDQRLAEKLGCSQDDSVATVRTPAAVHPCPVCFATVECAVKIAACAHAACAECLARWSILSEGCPKCGGVVDEVTRDLELDKRIMRDLQDYRNNQRPLLSYHEIPEDDDDDDL